MDVPVITARGLCKRYGPTVALQDLDLEVPAGEVFGFLGPNGAGKTTTIRLLLDLIRPSSGEAFLFGRHPGDPRVRARVGYLPGELALDGRLTAGAMLAILDGVRPRGTPPADPKRVAELCERLHLSDADLSRTIRDESRGTKQKIGLVSAFQHDPELLVLDEPTGGLDPLVREALFELMLEAGARGRTVFHSSHVLDEVERTCARVAILRAGRLVALESIDTLRDGLTRRMHVVFRDAVPDGLAELDGIDVIERDGPRVTLLVGGPLDPLLALLAQTGVDDMDFPEPDLEEAFARFYAGAES
jgi:ABC-2 type transport system ATP-binding protein